MNVALVDVDSKIPNVALMKASTWHKGRGDSVKFHDPLFDGPDLLYASKMFDFSPDYAYFPSGCDVRRGGPGYSLSERMPFPEYDKIMPDYSLYPKFDYAVGRFTRGCPNRCPWCVVPKMDGNRVRKVADLGDFWCGQKVVRLLDDNIMADPDVFCEACGQLGTAGVKVVWEALDIRLVDDRTAAALASVKNEKSVHFAWDGHAQDGFVERGIETLGRHGIKPWRLMFYVLVGFNTTREYDLHRVTTLHRLGANPFVMPYDKHDRYQKDFARWCNNKFIFKSTSWEAYNCPTNRGGCNEAHQDQGRPG